MSPANSNLELLFNLKTNFSIILYDFLFQCRQKTLLLLVGVIPSHFHTFLPAGESCEQGFGQKKYFQAHIVTQLKIEYNFFFFINYTWELGIKYHAHLRSFSGPFSSLSLLYYHLKYFFNQIFQSFKNQHTFWLGESPNYNLVCILGPSHI